jgi:NAD(P)-dependent dehydrogenase (short-subunit alcohol dehydrogenase family)
LLSPTRRRAVAVRGRASRLRGASNVITLRGEPDQPHDPTREAAQEQQDDRQYLPDELARSGPFERPIGVLRRVDRGHDHDHDAGEAEDSEDEEESTSADCHDAIVAHIDGPGTHVSSLRGVPVDPLAAFRLDGKVAIVTGASAGLGARFARVLDAAGARVVLAARRAERLDALAADLRDAHVVACDLAEDGAPSALVAAALAHFGQVDVLVNNAGRSEPTPAFDETTDHFAATLRVNLVAPFELARECARAMSITETGGAVVNVASIWGLVGVGQIPEAGYAASKGGLVNLTRELAAQWARKGVRVNCLAPGWFRTEMTDGLMFGDERSERWMKQRTPMGRGGSEEELDGALLFLASPASSFMTGQILCIDGGWTCV